MLPSFFESRHAIPFRQLKCYDSGCYPSLTAFTRFSIRKWFSRKVRCIILTGAGVASSRE